MGAQKPVKVFHTSQSYRREQLLHKRLGWKSLTYNWNTLKVTDESAFAHQGTRLSLIRTFSRGYKIFTLRN